MPALIAIIIMLALFAALAFIAACVAVVFIIMAGEHLIGWVKEVSCPKTWDN